MQTIGTVSLFIAYLSVLLITAHRGQQRRGFHTHAAATRVPHARRSCSEAALMLTLPDGTRHKCGLALETFQNYRGTCNAAHDACRKWTSPLQRVTIVASRCASQLLTSCDSSLCHSQRGRAPSRHSAAGPKHGITRSASRFGTSPCSIATAQRLDSGAAVQQPGRS